MAHGCPCTMKLNMGKHNMHEIYPMCTQVAKDTG